MIRNGTADQYVHFNPHVGKYLAGPTNIGAALFTMSNGTEFVNALKGEWKLEKMVKQVGITINGDREDVEKNIYDDTH